MSETIANYKAGNLIFFRQNYTLTMFTPEAEYHPNRQQKKPPETSVARTNLLPFKPLRRD